MIVAVAVLVLGVVSGGAGVLVGFFLLAEASPTRLLLLWDMFFGAFLFAWMIGMVSEIQRSETIDISRMLHLPISLRDIFLVNYIASHLTISIILFLPLVLGLCLGLLLSGRWSMILMFPLVLGVVFMITAWTYCLRGWLAALMVNKRRRRAIIAGVTFSFIVLVQLPNIISNLAHDRKKHRPNTVKSVPLEEQATRTPVSRNRRTLPHAVLVAHKVVPFLWIGNGAMSLGKGNALPAVLSATGAFCIGGLGLRRAYRTTIRFYQGHTTVRRTKQKPKARKVHAVSKNFLERKLPGIPDEAAALALAFFRSLMRAPEVKMALATNFIMLLLFGTMFFVRRMSNLSDNFKLFVASGPILFTFLGMSHLMFNQFGFDRGGFRQLVLLPVPRRHILLGKNLALLPIAIGIGLTLLVLIKIILRISFTIVLAAGLQLVATFMLLSIPHLPGIYEADQNICHDLLPDFHIAIIVSGGHGSDAPSTGDGIAHVPLRLAACRTCEPLALNGTVGAPCLLLLAQSARPRQPDAATRKTNPSSGHRKSGVNLKHRGNQRDLHFSVS